MRLGDADASRPNAWHPRRPNRKGCVRNRLAKGRGEQLNRLYNMDSPTDKTTAAIEELGGKPGALDGMGPIMERVPGWSRGHHFLFFKAVMHAMPELRSILILGVYMGRDICFMLEAAKFRPLQVVGVDKFNAEPCDDWPVEKRGMTWEEAFHCLPPSLELAAKNINALPPHDVSLIKADDADFLPGVTRSFDMIYVDTSHDKATCLRQFAQVKKLCHPNTIIAGDDYENLEATWGVKDAVAEAFTTHQVLADTIWFAGAGDYK